MKKLVVMGAIVASLFAALPTTAQQQTPSQKAQAKTLPSTQAFDKQMAEAQTLMKRMQEQMDSIRQSQDAQERQRLLQEHWTTMQSAMATMHGMWGPGTMGCCGAGPLWRISTPSASRSARSSTGTTTAFWRAASGPK